jgi:redox-sensing transcriptional repressor
MRKDIPLPTLERLCKVHRLLEDLEKSGMTRVSSTDLSARLGVGPPSIRKDIGYLGEIGNFRAGYDIRTLRHHLENGLGLNKKKKACIVGLGRLGSAILHYERLGLNGFDIVAGFDSSINRLETIATVIELHPAHEITEVVRRKGIALAVIAVPSVAAQEAADRLIEGGIRGIVNFSAAVLRPVKNIFVRDIDLVREFRILSVLSEPYWKKQQP